MKSKEYRWVQVVTSYAKESGNIYQLIGVTDSEDKNHGLDQLTVRHRTQIGLVDIAWSTITFMSADGEMSNLKLPS